MRLTTALFGAFAGGAYGVLTNRDPWKCAAWGGGVGLVTTLIGGANLSLGGVNLRVGSKSGPEALGWGHGEMPTPFGYSPYVRDGWPRGGGGHGGYPFNAPVWWAS